MKEEKAKNQGFTLVELLVAMAIAAVILTAIFPTRFLCGAEPARHDPAEREGGHATDLPGHTDGRVLHQF